jgi:oxygen-independent coproporphyrinogen-3 oxidase
MSYFLLTMLKITPELLQKFHKPAPRYTSYPTAPEWSSLASESYCQHLLRFVESEESLSLYIHIPFCKSMCLFCGCSVILNRKPENEEKYVRFLCQEISRVGEILGRKKKVSQIHFGGGTPTKLSTALLDTILNQLQKSFSMEPLQEFAIEIDPRTVIEDQGVKLAFLRKNGFNRISFGVQDTDPKVQEAVKRRQSYEMTKVTYELARTLGFEKINLDLIYGLPYQTLETFEKTVDQILAMRPDRIALFSYARVPWLKPHQKALPDEKLPTMQEKFAIYAMTREKFVHDGYIAIGMDHFALEEDELSQSYRKKMLQRNFQGYSVQLANHGIGFGVTAIGFISNAYFQNSKDLNSYYDSLNQGKLPVHRGKILSWDDELRKWVIHSLMCTFELDKSLFFHRYAVNFDTYFSSAKPIMDQHLKDGLIEETTEKIKATPMGELFIRNIVMAFDAYLHSVPHQKFSQSI